MNTEKILEIDKIKEKWSALAVTKGAKEKIQEQQIYLSEVELRKSIKDTTESRDMMERFGTPPLASLEETPQILQASTTGMPLTPHQLERIEVTLAAVKRMKEYLNKGKTYRITLAFYEENFDALEELREEIARQIRNGQVDDYASGTLSDIRQEIQRLEEKMKMKAEQFMHTHKEAMADHFYTFRNGRICVPVKKEYKLKVSGSVIDKSATGSTLFIEPTAVAKYYEELDLLRIEEENEVYRILYTLTAMVSDHKEEMDQNIAMMEKMDYIFSKGKLSMDLKATEPMINTGRTIRLKDARHPLMDPAVNVPLQLSMDEETCGIIITGPNTGGKTVSIKTVALNCYMAQCGLHVTCKEADICMNNAYLCDIGDGQNMAENLSTFSAHIKNVLEIVGKVSRDSLVIMDELGSGTDPTEGMGIAIAILEELRKSGCLFLVTTHYPEVKEYALRSEHIVNARMTFDKETLRPTYQMVVGEAGESCAFYIAGRLGMSRAMLETAIEAAYGADAVAEYGFTDQLQEKTVRSTGHSSIRRKKEKTVNEALSENFRLGDCVMVYPDHKLAIVCEPVNEKGTLRVQLSNQRKIWINHKRVKLHVAAAQMYPEDYDFSIVFDSVEVRKARHEMERKYTERELHYEE